MAYSSPFWPRHRGTYVEVQQDAKLLPLKGNDRVHLLLHKKGSASLVSQSYDLLSPLQTQIDCYPLENLLNVSIPHAVVFGVLSSGFGYQSQFIFSFSLDSNPDEDDFEDLNVEFLTNDGHNLEGFLEAGVGMLVFSIGQDHMGEVPVAGNSCFLQHLIEFDHELASLNQRISEGSSSLGIDFFEDDWYVGVLCILKPKF